MNSTTTALRAKLDRTVPLLMLVVAFAHFNRIGISVVGAQRIIPEYGISTERMGLIYSAFLLSYTLAMLPGGWFIDRFGARAALLLLGFGSAAFVAMTGLVGYRAYDAASLWLGLMVVRSVLGAVNAPLHPAAARMVYEHVPPRSRAFSNGLVTFAAVVGIASTFYGMGWLIDRFDWPVAFLLSGGATLIVAMVWTLFTRSSAGAADGKAERALPRPDLASLMVVLRDRSVICITLSYGAFGYFQYLFFYWINYYFEEVQGRSSEETRKYSTLVTLAMGVGMVSGGWLADRVPLAFSPRLRRAFVPALGMIGGGIIFELGLIAPDARGTLVAFTIAAAFIGACEGGFWTTAVELGGRLGGTAGALMNTGGNAGGTLSPYLTPLLSGLFAQSYGEALGWRLSLAVAGAISVAGAALWWGIRPPARPDPEIDTSLD